MTFQFVHKTSFKCPAAIDWPNNGLWFLNTWNSLSRQLTLVTVSMSYYTVHYWIINSTFYGLLNLHSIQRRSTWINLVYIFSSLRCWEEGGAGRDIRQSTDQLYHTPAPWEGGNQIWIRQSTAVLRACDCPGGKLGCCSVICLKTVNYLITTSSLFPKVFHINLFPAT